MNVFALQDLPLDLRTSTAVESLLSLRGARVRPENWLPPSPASSTTSEGSVSSPQEGSTPPASPASLASPQKSPYVPPVGTASELESATNEARGHVAMTQHGPLAQSIVSLYVGTCACVCFALVHLYNIQKGVR